MSEQAPSDQDVRQHFTERAASYTGGQGDTVEAMVAMAAPGPNAKALDVATGTGLVAFALAAEITGSGYRHWRGFHSRHARPCCGAERGRRSGDQRRAGRFSCR